MSPADRVDDIEMQAAIQQDSVDVVFPRTFPETKTMTWNFQDMAGQCCFLCLESPKRGQYAVLVPCLRPTRYREVVGLSDVFSDPKPIYEELCPWESACEQDSDIYRRLVDTCYRYQGRWKRWLPLYGVIDVQEVTFMFTGTVERDGRYHIRMGTVDVEKFKADCEKAIAKQPVGPLVDYSDACLDGKIHSETCRVGMENWSEPCIRDEAEKAEGRLYRLPLRELLPQYARDPTAANGLHTLEGLVQESCIYQTRGRDRVQVPEANRQFKGTVSMRGLSFVLGWQTDRMARELPVGISCAWLAIALVWLCVLLWSETRGDWGTALGLGQVVAASVCIVVALARGWRWRVRKKRNTLRLYRGKSLSTC